MASGLLAVSGYMYGTWVAISANLGGWDSPLFVVSGQQRSDYERMTQATPTHTPYNKDIWQPPAEHPHVMWADIFWERVYINIESNFYYGNEIDVGLVVFPASYDAEIWNAYRTQNVTLNTIVWTNGEGVSVSGITTPLGVKKLESKFFSVVVSEIGPVTIGASGLFSFDAGDQDLYVVGTRGLPIIIAPDRDGYSEIRFYNTDVFTAEDGTERRRALMDYPKRKAEYRISTYEQEQVNKLENLAYTGTKYICLQPLWLSKTVLVSGCSGDSSTIFVDTSNKEYVVGDYVLIKMSDLHYDIKQIITVSGSFIIVDKPPMNFPAGTTVVPMAQMTMEETVPFGGKHRRFQGFEFKLREL